MANPAEELFKKPTLFVKGVADLSQLPTQNLPEIAFAGRSNVGKSSLINALTGQKGLAKASGTPGRTQQLNYFCVDNRAFLVDLPGYGFAQAPKKMVEAWTNLVLYFLKNRSQLKRVFVLIDSRHGAKQSDIEMMTMLDKAGVSYQLVLTKKDKITQTAAQQILQQTQTLSTQHTACYPEVLMTSSEKKEGISELRVAFYKAIKNL